MRGLRIARRFGGDIYIGFDVLRATVLYLSCTPAPVTNILDYTLYAALFTSLIVVSASSPRPVHHSIRWCQLATLQFAERHWIGTR